MTTNNEKNAVGGWGGFVYFRASLRPAQAGTAFRGGVFARPAQAGTDANGLSFSMSPFSADIIVVVIPAPHWAPYNKLKSLSYIH